MATAAQRHKINRDPVSDPHILLTEIEEEHSGSPLRLAVNNEAVTSNSEEYSPAGIEFSIPGQGEEPSPPRATISNVNRAAGRAILLSRDMIMVRFMVIDVTAPDTSIIDTLDQFVITASSITAEDVSVTLGSAVDWQMPYPLMRATQANFPGAWAQRT